MSLGRHAYRHAIQPPSRSLVDHVWISEDFLASTFRRFANGHHQQQRRYESRVPGPLEARRRLAKRRNTALAGVAGPGPLDDIACLSGRNGRDHMKWTTDGKGRTGSATATATAAQPRGSHPRQFDFSSNNPFASYNQDVHYPRGFDPPPSWPVGLGATPDIRSTEEALIARVDTCRTVADVRNIVHQLRIDLMREPECSQLIFGRLLSRSALGQVSTEELLMFLDDPFLNIRGAGNYQSVAEHLVSSAADHPGHQALLGTVVRALELGLIPPEELCDIVRTVATLPARSRAVDAEGTGSALPVYRQMWDAIGRCDIYRHKDLDSTIVDAWLGALEDETACASFGLAKDIIVATQRPDCLDCPWVAGFITRELEFRMGTGVSDERHGVAILQHFVPEVASEYIIGVTESLVSSKRADLLERWQDFLLKLDDVSALVRAQRWTEVQKQPVATGLSPRHQIVLRVWLLRTLSRNLPEGPLWRRAPRATDASVCDLFDLYQSVGEVPTQDFLLSLMRGIHELGLPSNGLLLMASQLKFQKSLTPTARRTLKAMESPPVSFAAIFADVHAYNAVAPHFFSALQEAVQQIDITSPSFIAHSIELARTGDSHSVWTLLRIFRSHTPLKIALSMSWESTSAPETAPAPRPTTRSYPDPQAALEMINSLAVSLSCSRQFSPRCAYKLVHWLYVFLVRHEAPVKPALVRAMYHAGVVRFRREGRRVSATQYAFIMALVKDTEGVDLVAELMSPQVGRTGLADEYVG